MEPDTVWSYTVVPDSRLHGPVVPDTVVPCTDVLYKLSVYLKRKNYIRHKLFNYIIIK